ncbi:hypothetical protein WOLCODRAFT_17953 [Wolfiporia cocos MD-104 SS10]|uniref:Uncharacterized protein n=1 Tax=Wolfiporia cocos (strain MD-104) TaxID=742152 RepID=A0A2H3JKV0_WOLCO|nr:hypothetical protein WOLCODRAFT_17953 [Wolfiporia cocos MD-104 SS10]
MTKIKNTEYFEFIRDVVGLKVKAIGRKNQETHLSSSGTPPKQSTGQPLDGEQRSKWIEGKVRGMFLELVRLRALFDGAIQPEEQRELMMAMLRQVRVMEAAYIKKFCSSRSRQNKPLEEVKERKETSDAVCGPTMDTLYATLLEIKPRDYVTPEVLDLFELAGESKKRSMEVVNRYHDSDGKEDLSTVMQNLSGTTQDFNDAAQAPRPRLQSVSLTDMVTEIEGEDQHKGLPEYSTRECHSSELGERTHVYATRYAICREVLPRRIPNSWEEEENEQSPEGASSSDNHDAEEDPQHELYSSGYKPDKDEDDEDDDDNARNDDIICEDGDRHGRTMIATKPMDRAVSVEMDLVMSSDTNEESSDIESPVFSSGDDAVAQGPSLLSSPFPDPGSRNARACARQVYASFLLPPQPLLPSPLSQSPPSPPADHAVLPPGDIDSRLPPSAPVNPYDHQQARYMYGDYYGWLLQLQTKDEGYHGERPTLRGCFGATYNRPYGVGQTNLAPLEEHTRPTSTFHGVQQTQAPHRHAVVPTPYSRPSVDGHQSSSHAYQHQPPRDCIHKMYWAEHTCLEFSIGISCIIHAKGVANDLYPHVRAGGEQLEITG